MNRIRTVRRRLPLLLVLLATCTGHHAPLATSRTSAPGTSSVPGSSPPTAGTTPTDPASRLEAAQVRLVRLVAMKDPVAMTSRPGDDGLYVADREGRVWVIRDGTRSARPLLDLSGRITFGGDRGLLGATFAPDGSFLYVSYIDHANAVRLDALRWRVGAIDPGSRRTLLSIPQPTIRHHAGDLHFGPDGYLWMTTGDGWETDPPGNAQKLDVLLGKLLRIDPTPEARKPYRIPPDNPFVHRPGARPEIYAYGLRNPWRFSIDQATGDVWIGDVGQFEMEEVDLLPAGAEAGANFGWNRLEGTLPYAGKAPRDAVPPLHEYRHTEGRCAVMGGYVYRGSAIPDLAGAYVSTDFCDGRLRALLEEDGTFVTERFLGPHLSGLAAFGQGPDGELYAMSLFSGIYRIVPA